MKLLGPDHKIFFDLYSRFIRLNVSPEIAKETSLKLSNKTITFEEEAWAFIDLSQHLWEASINKTRGPRR